MIRNKLKSAVVAFSLLSIIGCSNSNDSDIIKNSGVRTDIKAPMIYINDGAAFYTEDIKNTQRLTVADDVSFLNSPHLVKLERRNNSRVYNLQDKSIGPDTDNYPLTDYQKRLVDAKKTLDKIIFRKIDDYDVDTKGNIYFLSSGYFENTNDIVNLPTGETLPMSELSGYLGLIKNGSDKVEEFNITKSTHNTNPFATPKESDYKFFFKIKVSPDDSHVAYIRASKESGELNPIYEPFLLDVGSKNITQIQGERFKHCLDIEWVSDKVLALSTLVQPRTIYTKDGLIFVLGFRALDPAVLGPNNADLLDSDKITFYNIDSKKTSLIDGHELKVYR